MSLANQSGRMDAIEYTPSTPQDGQRKYPETRKHVEWLLIMGWVMDRKPDGLHLSHKGQKKIVRGGVVING